MVAEKGSNLGIIVCIDINESMLTSPKAISIMTRPYRHDGNSYGLDGTLIISIGKKLCLWLLSVP